MLVVWDVASGRRAYLPRLGECISGCPLWFAVVPRPLCKLQVPNSVLAAAP